MMRGKMDPGETSRDPEPDEHTARNVKEKE